MTHFFVVADEAAMPDLGPNAVIPDKAQAAIWGLHHADPLLSLPIMGACYSPEIIVDYESDSQSRTAD